MTATRQPARRVGIDELPALLGQTLGPSAPLLITQDRIDEFAAATGDQQWLHVDAGRAAAGPFGTTIAHGYLTLSLFTTMLWSLLEVPDAAQVINYGLGKVRFPASVPAGCEPHRPGGRGHPGRRRPPAHVRRDIHAQRNLPARLRPRGDIPLHPAWSSRRCWIRPR